MNHPAVKLVRDTFRYCPNAGFRRDIVVTAEQDMKLWEQVVSYWKRMKFNPLNYKGMMQEFDFRYMKHAKSSRDSSQKPDVPRSRKKGVSKWSDW